MMRWRVPAPWTAVLAVVLSLAIPIPATAVPYYDVEITEEGASLGPGEDGSDLFLESHPRGGHYLIRGHGHAGEARVLDGTLSTVTVIEPPRDGYLVKGCTFSDWGVRLLVWGRAPGDANDTVVLFDADEGAYGDDVVPNGTVPLVTVDHARLFATELILMVAGRDGNGTSRVLFIETMTNDVLNQVDVPGDRTVVHAEDNGNHVPVMDEEGGLLVFESFNWTLSEEVPPLTSDPTVHELHPGRFWTLATEDGTVIIGQHFGTGTSYRYQVAEGPLEGALYNKRPNNALFAVTARPAVDGGSTLEVWWVRDIEWARIHGTSTDKAVSFIHHVPGGDDLFLIGYEDGSVVQYSIDIREIPPDPRDPWYKEGRIWVTLAVIVIVGIALWMRTRKSRS